MNMCYRMKWHCHSTCAVLRVIASLPIFSIQGSKIDTYNTLWYMRPRYFSVWKDIESYIEHGDGLNGFRMKIEWKNTPSLERKPEMDQVTWNWLLLHNLSNFSIYLDRSLFCRINFFEFQFWISTKRILQQLQIQQLS